MSPKKYIHAIALSTIFVASFMSTVATAQQSGERRGPPPEAIEACVNQTVNAACSFTGPRGDATGQCMAGPQGTEILACMPAGGPPKQSDS